MSAKRTAVLVFIGLLAAGLAQLVVYVPHLPDQVVTRIEGGQPLTLIKAAIVGIHVLILLLSGLYFLGLSFLFDKLPERYFKVLPESDYWLAPERMAQTRAYLASRFLWLGDMTLAMFLITYQLIYMTNVSPNPNHRLLTTTSVLASTLYLSAVFIGVIRMNGYLRRRGRPRGRG
jgi:hypothetical protein